MIKKAFTALIFSLVLTITAQADFLRIELVKDSVSTKATSFAINDHDTSWLTGITGEPFTVQDLIDSQKPQTHTAKVGTVIRAQKLNNTVSYEIVVTTFVSPTAVESITYKGSVEVNEFSSVKVKNASQFDTVTFKLFNPFSKTLNDHDVDADIEFN